MGGGRYRSWSWSSRRPSLSSRQLTVTAAVTVAAHTSPAPRPSATDPTHGASSAADTATVDDDDRPPAPPPPHHARPRSRGRCTCRRPAALVPLPDQYLKRARRERALLGRAAAAQVDDRSEAVFAPRADTKTPGSMPVFGGAPRGRACRRPSLETRGGSSRVRPGRRRGAGGRALPHCPARPAGRWAPPPLGPAVCHRRPPGVGRSDRARSCCRCGLPASPAPTGLASRPVALPVAATPVDSMNPGQLWLQAIDSSARGRTQDAADTWRQTRGQTRRYHDSRCRPGGALFPARLVAVTHTSAAAWPAKMAQLSRPARRSSPPSAVCRQIPAARRRSAGRQKRRRAAGGAQSGASAGQSGHRPGLPAGQSRSPVKRPLTLLGRSGITKGGQSIRAGHSRSGRRKSALRRAPTIEKWILKLLFRGSIWNRFPA